MPRPDRKAADAYTGLRPFFFVSYILRTDYVLRAGYALRARGLERRLRGGASGMSEIQMGLIFVGILVVVILILLVVAASVCALPRVGVR